MLKLVRDVAVAALAERCPACGGPSAAGFCPGCAAELPLIDRPCMRCGLPRPAGRCPRRSADWPVSSVVAPFRYAPPIDAYLQKLKFGRGRRLGRALALAMATRLRDVPGPGSRAGPVLVPVPLHRRRLVERGYNQAAEIARALGEKLRLRIELAAAVRRGPLVPQSRLPAYERAENVADAFAVRLPVRGLELVIVDDVITTGATVNALARVLLEAGAERVDAWAAARTV